MFFSVAGFTPIAIGDREYVKTKSVCGYGAADTGFLTSGEEHTNVNGRTSSTTLAMHTRQRRGTYLLSTLDNNEPHTRTKISC
jgi:hypothetical protein